MMSDNMPTREECRARYRAAAAKLANPETTRREQIEAALAEMREIARIEQARADAESGARHE
jgi:hypothetical protein